MMQKSISRHMKLACAVSFIIVNIKFTGFFFIKVTLSLLVIAVYVKSAMHYYRITTEPLSVLSMVL